MSIDLVAKIPAEGFDPSASRLWDSRSNQLSYTGLQEIRISFVFILNDLVLLPLTGHNKILWQLLKWRIIIVNNFIDKVMLDLKVTLPRLKTLSERGNIKTAKTIEDKFLTLTT